MTDPNYIPYTEEVEKPFDYKRYLYLFKVYSHVVLTFFVIVITLTFISVSKIAPSYQATAQIIVERPRPVWKGDPSDTSMWTEGFMDEYYNTQTEIMKGNTVMRQVVDELKLVDYFEVPNEDVAAAQLSKMISIQRLKESRLFNITTTAGESKFAAELANSVANAYIRKNFEDVLYYSREVLAWLPTEGPPDETITIKDVTGRARQMTREQLLESLPSVRTDPTIRQLKEKISSLEAELQLLERQYKAKHPLIVKTQANLKFLQESIELEKSRVIDGLKSKAEGALQVSLARIVEEAQSPKAPLPIDRIKPLVVAGLGQLCISFLIIFLMDYFDPSIHAMEDLERKGVMLPFLGPIPLVKGKFKENLQRSIISYYEKNSEIAEAFRYLRVAINFSTTPESLKNLIISSSLPHEGKSFVSNNLAVSFAQDGNRTLLVDADLRRPIAHRIFKLDNLNGLSNFLTSNIDFTAVLKETFVENLIVVPSGPTSPNPGEILGSNRMKKFIEEARSRFDRIIIDCPPLTGIGDGFVVGSLIGQLILVIAARKTPADLIKHTDQQLQKSGIKVIGTVLNMVDVEKERYYGYSKHYYHVYDRYHPAAGKEEKASTPSD